MKYAFIVNPNSRSGMGLLIWEQLEPELKKRQVDYEGFLTEYPGHATQLARQITEDGREYTMVALGGDGTVNEVINGIVEVEKVVFGYIPTGSSNDFARGLGLPQNPMEALQIILHHGYTRKMDIGLFTLQGKKRRFAVSAGVGFDAAICHQAVNSRLKVVLNRLKLGKLTYVIIALNRLFRDSRLDLKITLDGEEKFFEKAYFAAVMNIPFEGGGLRFCPKADSQDGFLDVIVINKLPRLFVLLLLPTAYKGWHVYFPGVHVFRCKKVEFFSPERIPAHTDGEPLFVEQNAVAEVLDGQISVITQNEKE